MARAYSVCQNDKRADPTNVPMPSTTNKKILITGAPGVGKTTLIRRLIRRLDTVKYTGFYTSEIREGGVRKGFELIGFDGQKGLLAHINIQGPYRVGRYGVDVKGFDKFLDTIGFMQTEADVVVIDEIGKMEMLSKKFIHLLDTIFSSEQQVIATISAGGPETIQRYKQRVNVTLIEVTRSNRDRLADKIAPLVTHCGNNR